MSTPRPLRHRLAAAALLALAAAAAQAQQPFLKIAGIDGGSTARGHERWIDVLGWSWGLRQGEGGAAVFDPFRWQQGLDSAVVPLFLGVAQAQKFDVATLDVVREGEGGGLFFQMVFDGVTPTALNIDSGSFVDAAFRYEAVTMRYHDGKKWIEGRFALGPSGVGFAGDAQVLAGLFAAGGDVALEVGPLPPVPEPGSWALMATGLLAGAWRLRRQAPAANTA